MDQLTKLRSEIDQVDQEMQALFVKRMAIVTAITEYKKNHGISAYDASRESEVIRRNTERIAGSPFSAHYERFLRCILAESKQLQADLGIGEAGR